MLQLIKVDLRCIRSGSLSFFPGAPALQCSVMASRRSCKIELPQVPRNARQPGVLSFSAECRGARTPRQQPLMPVTWRHMRAPVARVLLDQRGAPGAEPADERARCGSRLPQRVAEVVQLPAHAPSIHRRPRPRLHIILWLHTRTAARHFSTRNVYHAAVFLCGVSSASTRVADVKKMYKRSTNALSKAIPLRYGRERETLGPPDFLGDYMFRGVYVQEVELKEWFGPPIMK